MRCIIRFGTLKDTLPVTSLVVPPQKTLTSLRLRFQRACQVQHENLVRFYGVCIDSPPLRIVTEFCHSDPLGSVGSETDNRLKRFVA